MGLEFLSKKVFINIFGFEIYNYAVFIITGAIITYFTCQYLAKRNGYAKKIISDAFLLVFPIGVLGARLWYCIANMQSFQNIWQVFNFRDGGLAVEGGVILGALSGIWYFRKFYPKESLRFWADIVVPNILIAQAIGRWGNFFNDEVYGLCTPISNWSWLPGFIVEDMSSLCVAGSNTMAVPLFLIEGTINVLGWILITFVLRKFWHRGRRLGDLAAFYFIWYGAVRLILEPLRNEKFIMRIYPGGPATTMILSALMVGGGILFMIISRFIKDKVVNDYEYSDVLDKVEDKKDSND